MYHILYKTTCLVNGKVYIGIHSTQNLNDGYLGSGVLLRRAIKEHGRDNFRREIIAQYNSRNELLKAESDYVSYDFVNSEDNYNLALGGGACRGGLKADAEKFLRADSLYVVYSKGDLVAVKKPSGNKYVDYVRQLVVNMIPKALNEISWMLSSKEHHNDGKIALNALMNGIEYPENIVVEQMEWDCIACSYQ